MKFYKSDIICIESTLNASKVSTFKVEISFGRIKCKNVSEKWFIVIQCNTYIYVKIETTNLFWPVHTKIYKRISEHVKWTKNYCWKTAKVE